MDGQDSSNYTMTRVGEPNLALSSLVSCLNTRWTQMMLDTPDMLTKSAVSSAISVLGVDVAFAAMEDIISADGATLLPALETLDPQAVFFLKYAQSQCSMMTLEQRDLDRAIHHHLLGREKLRGVLSQFVQFQHYYFCEEESENVCDPLL